MSEMQEQVKLLQFRFKGHEHETDGFTWDYTAATDEQVLNVAPISKDTIEGLCGVIMKIIKPKYRRKLKRQIVYLVGLRHRQKEVLAAYMEDCQNRTNNVNQWVQQHKP